MKPAFQDEDMYPVMFGSIVHAVFHFCKNRNLFAGQNKKPDKNRVYYIFKINNLQDKFFRQIIALKSVV